MVWGYFLICLFYGATSLAGGPFRTGGDVHCTFRLRVCYFAGWTLCRTPGLWTYRARETRQYRRGASALPVEARFAAYPTYNHPVLLQAGKLCWDIRVISGRKDSIPATQNNRLTALMNGAANWREAAKALGVRYMFWGQDEKTNYQSSSRPWEATSFLVASAIGRDLRSEHASTSALACDGVFGVDECLMEARLSAVLGRDVQGKQNRSRSQNR